MLNDREVIKDLVTRRVQFHFWQHFSCKKFVKNIINLIINIDCLKIRTYFSISVSFKAIILQRFICNLIKVDKNGTAPHWLQASSIQLHFFVAVCFSRCHSRTQLTPGRRGCGRNLCSNRRFRLLHHRTNDSLLLRDWNMPVYSTDRTRRWEVCSVKNSLMCKLKGAIRRF